MPTDKRVHLLVVSPLSDKIYKVDSNNQRNIEIIENIFITTTAQTVHSVTMATTVPNILLNGPEMSILNAVWCSLSHIVHVSIP